MYHQFKGNIVDSGRIRPIISLPDKKLGTSFLVRALRCDRPFRGDKLNCNKYKISSNKPGIQETRKPGCHHPQKPERTPVLRNHRHLDVVTPVPVLAHVIAMDGVTLRPTHQQTTTNRQTRHANQHSECQIPHTPTPAPTLRGRRRQEVVTPAPMLAQVIAMDSATLKPVHPQARREMRMRQPQLTQLATLTPDPYPQMRMRVLIQEVDKPFYVFLFCFLLY
ncbi:uncharacterized protein LOC121380378 [Gigantopelta aegis]|uniref:uncharacterized protein LOC121380378 n=1 Tax=Gigantopelta aegis TaxID=1735272 RepID=UPI001B88DEFA|nr:uncharacterized protein LOC121380378 [Gigantopelta aegis]